ncbi:MAG: PaaI family thioesterase [Arenicella sp.]|nr:PaaI family thioesterase [Arenicella sp.]
MNYRAVSKDTLIAFFDSEFPNNALTIESVGDKKACIRRTPKQEDLRPGNTVSGPFMMSIADTALYVTILAELGLVALAVTTSLNFNFLRKPTANADVVAKCTLLKVGRKLVVGEVTLYSDGDERPIAHAVGTYSLPS